MDDYTYNYIERMAIMTESGVAEDIAHAEALHQVRQEMVADGMDFGRANMMVMGIRKRLGGVG